MHQERKMHKSMARPHPRGRVVDFKNGSLCDWPVQHGLDQCLRVPGLAGRRELDGGDLGLEATDIMDGGLDLIELTSLRDELQRYPCEVLEKDELG